MGRRGPQKKPAAAKRRDGTYRSDRDRGVEAPTGRPECPEWLGPEGRAEWERRTGQLQRLGLISEIDQVAFALYCQAYEQMIRAMAIVAEEGFVSTTDKGNLIQHPVVAVLHKARADLIKIGREFGMTPSSRSGLSIAGEDPDDPLASLEKGRGRKPKGRK